MKVEKLEHGGVAILHPSGVLTMDRENDPLGIALQELAREGNSRAVVNLEHVSWINSTGLSMLIAGYKEYGTRSGKLKLCSVSGNPQMVLVITKLTQYFEIFANEKEAIASYARSANIKLMSEGVCLYTGENHRCHPGKTALFSHIQPDGAQVLTVYGNLNDLGNLYAGELYPTGYPVGTLASLRLHQVPSLHFAVAYGATWDTDLQVNPTIPINAGTNWIQDRYQNPLEVLQHYA